MLKLSPFILQYSSVFHIFTPFHGWENEVQRGKLTCLKIPASRGKIRIGIYTSSLYHDGQSLQVMAVRNSGRHPKHIVDSPPKCLGSRSKRISTLCQEMKMPRHIHVLTDREFTQMVKAVMYQGKISHPQALWNCFTSPATKREKNQKKNWIVSRNVSSYDSKIHGGADLLTQKGPFLSHLAAFTTL